MNWSRVGAQGHWSVPSSSTCSHSLQAGIPWWPSCCCLAKSVLLKAPSCWILKNSRPGIWCTLYGGAKFSGVSSFSEFVKIISFIGLSRTVYLVDTESEKHENNPYHEDARKKSQIGTKILNFFHLRIINFKCILLNSWRVILAQWLDVVSLICDQNFSINAFRHNWCCNI